MMYDGYVCRSVDKGASWIQTAFSKVIEDPNDPYRMNGQKAAVDPNNPQVAYMGTPQNGLFVTKDGGTSWQHVAAIPASLTDAKGLHPSITGILFDPVLGGTSGGITNTIFASSYGNGVYKSTDAGASWTHLAGGPTDVENAAISSTGIYYAIGDGGTDLWSYANNEWKELLTPTVVGVNQVQAVAIDPADPSRIAVVTPGGSLNISYDAGATWSGNNWAGKLNSTDIPWLADTGPYMSIGGMRFSPSVPHEIIVSDGVGVWTTSFPKSRFAWNTPVVWNDQSVGIEQLVANDMAVPPGGDPVLASMDRAFFKIDNAAAYPSRYGPIMSDKVVAGFSVDYASSDPSFFVGIAQWWGREEFGIFDRRRQGLEAVR